MIENIWEKVFLKTDHGLLCTADFVYDFFVSRHKLHLLKRKRKMY